MSLYVKRRGSKVRNSNGSMSDQRRGVLTVKNIWRRWNISENEKEIAMEKRLNMANRRRSPNLACWKTGEAPNFIIGQKSIYNKQLGGAKEGICSLRRSLFPLSLSGIGAIMMTANEKHDATKEKKMPSLADTVYSSIITHPLIV